MELDDEQPYIFTIEMVLSPDECTSLIDFIDDNEPAVAPVNTLDGERQRPEVRNNERVMKEDPALAQEIFGRVKARLPARVFAARLSGLNELFRCYRYRPGMHFAPHTDGAYRRDEEERSYYTFLIYLNSVEQGGETAFVVDPEVVIKPDPGLGLLFQHPIMHEGCEVIAGNKYVIRTDVMYSTREDSGG